MTYLQKAITALAGLICGYVGAAIVHMGFILAHPIFREYLLTASVAILFFLVLFLFEYRRKYPLFLWGLLAGGVFWSVTTYYLVYIRQIFT